MAKSIPKTNAMRILETLKVPYTMHTYDPGGEIDGISVAEKLGQNKDQVFKTLVTKGRSGEQYVFVIPVAEELDLKAAAHSVSEKSVEMIHVKDIQKVTGYIRGGCSPLGMKKQVRTVIDELAKAQPTVIVSGGKIGFQMELTPEDLANSIGAAFALITA